MTRSMATKYVKHVKVVIQCCDLPPKNLHKPLNICSYEVMWQIINIISPLLQCLWLSILSGGWVITRSFHPNILMTPHWGGLVRSRGKLDTLYLHLQRPMDIKLSKMLTYSKMLPPVKPHDFLVTWLTIDHVTVWKILTSIFIRLMITKLDRVLTSSRSFSMQTFVLPQTSCY